MENIVTLSKNERFTVNVAPGVFQVLKVDGRLICSKVCGELTAAEQKTVKNELADRQTFKFEENKYMIAVIPELISAGDKTCAVRFVKY